MVTIAFIIPLRSPGASRDWQKVSRLCSRTLGSLSRQTSGDWRAILVCNAPPEGADTFPNVTVISDDFPVPRFERSAQIDDKQAKKVVGLEAASDFDPWYVMAVDADDLLHRRLVEFIGTNHHHPGWQMRFGYEYGGGLVARRRRGYFDRRCGTCSILAYQPLKSDSSPFQVPHDRLRAHRIQGGVLRPLPFYGAVHVLDTGDNLSGASAMSFNGIGDAMRTVYNMRPVTPAFCETYNLIPRVI